MLRRLEIPILHLSIRTDADFEGRQVMQATANTTTRQFGFNRFNTALVTLGLTAAIAIGAAIAGNFPSIGSDDSAIVLPEAHVSANAGEGLLAGTSDVTAAVRAHTDDRQGDGILGGNLAAIDRPQAHTALGQGDGIVGGHTSAADLTPAPMAYVEAGMGEGWAAYGRPRTMIKAYTSVYQGDGLVNTNR
jgi:hypothetical protein